MHISAPSEKHGIVFARGNFEQSMYSSLARAQRHFGGESTFGLELDDTKDPFDPKTKTGTSLRLGGMIERGAFNYRWPFNEYALGLNEQRYEVDEVKESDYIKEKEVGTCAILSFVKERTLYQILQLESSCRSDVDECYSFPSDGQVIISIGGLIRFRRFELPSHVNAESDKIGVTSTPLNKKAVTVSSSMKDPFASLNVKLYRVANDGTWEDLELIEAPNYGDNSNVMNSAAFSCCEKLLKGHMKGDARSSSPTITFIAAFSLRGGGEAVAWPAKGPPTSEEIYDHIGINSKEKHAAGAMWETIFTQREQWTDSTSELSEVSLIPRCLEKILHVDLVPAAILRKQPSTNGTTKDVFEQAPLALMSNLFLQPNVDLKSLL